MSTIFIIALPLFCAAAINTVIVVFQMKNSMEEDNRQKIDETAFLLKGYFSQILFPFSQLPSLVPVPDVEPFQRSALEAFLITSGYYTSIYLFSGRAELLASIPLTAPAPGFAPLPEQINTPVWGAAQNVDGDISVPVSVAFPEYTVRGIVNLNIISWAVVRAEGNGGTHILITDVNGMLLNSESKGINIKNDQVFEKLSAQVFTEGVFLRSAYGLLFVTARQLEPEHMTITGVSVVSEYFSSLPQSIIRVTACMIFLAILAFLIFVIEFNRKFQRSVYGLISDIKTFAERNEFPETMEPDYRELIPLTEAFTRMGEVIHMRENTINKDLEEKKVLLREIHHRVKNNLQIIMSLLNLQEGYLYDERDRYFFDKTKQRIYTIALVHEKFYESDNMAVIDFFPYAADLAKNLDTDSGVTVEVTGTRTIIPLERAIPCALIVLELTTNALQHAFVNTDNGSIHIDIRRNGEYAEITISDNGVGVPENGFIRGLGLILAQHLSRQLKADLSIKNSGGTTCSLRFAV